jgi:WD40 repeat protein
MANTRMNSQVKEQEMQKPFDANRLMQRIGVGVALLVGLFLPSCVSQEPLRTEHCTSLAYSADGRLLIIGTSEMNAATEAQPVETVGNGGSLIIFDVANKKTREKIDAGGSVYKTAVSPDGLMIAINSGTEMISVWDISMKNRLAHLTAKGAINDLVFSPNSETLAAATSDPERFASQRIPVPLLSSILQP